MPSKRSRNAFARSAASHAEAGVATAVTLAFRLPILFAAPGASVTAEWTRAMTEKFTAGVQGGAAAGLAMHSLTLRAMGGKVGVEKLGEEWMAIGDAALRPAYRTVAANAKRLSRR